ncbi:t-SNARE [Backusella circina FSU 941]|nr:t-SNARE [Backusella circina FSU 941]
MIYKDRTSEFYALAERIKKRGKGSSLEKGKNFYGNGTLQKKSNPRSDFSKMASELGRNIARTYEKVEQLTSMTKSRASLERPVEVAEITYKIKQDIAALNQQINLLQNHTKNQGGPNQVKEHKNNVLLSLQSKLANASLSFKDTLETQSEIASSGASEIDPRPQPRRRVNATRDISTPSPPLDESPQSLGIPMITQQQQQVQQQVMMEQNDRNIESRSAAMETIESTIAELGGIFQQLATMVAEQRETIQRIDQNTDDVEMNVLGARSELLKYYQNMSGNRGFIIKVFVTVILLFLLFSVIL